VTTRLARDVALIERLYFDQGWEPVAIAAQMHRDAGWVGSVVDQLRREPQGGARERRRDVRLNHSTRQERAREASLQLAEIRRQIAALNREAQRLELICVTARPAPVPQRRTQPDARTAAA
jgi:hypothetical protein